MNADRRSPYIAHRELADGARVHHIPASPRHARQRYHVAREVYIGGARAGYWAAAAATLVVVIAWCMA